MHAYTHPNLFKQVVEYYSGVVERHVSILRAENPSWDTVPHLSHNGIEMSEFKRKRAILPSAAQAARDAPDPRVAYVSGSAFAH